MAAESVKDTEITDSRNTIENEFYYLMQQLIMNPSQLNIIVENLQPVISSLNCDSDFVKFTLEFYKREHAFPTQSLLIQLVARGIIVDTGFLEKSCFGPFLSQLLFESVTESSIECSKYSTRVWIDSIIKENSSSTQFPNPLEYLDQNSVTHPSIIPHSVLLQFKLLDGKQRKLVMLDLRQIANRIPPTFYPRVIIAFLIFLEFYKKEEKGGGNLIPEICLWAETWHNLLVNSITGSRAAKDGNLHLPLHHLLNGTMVSSNAFQFMSTIPEVFHNVLKSLRLFDQNSSGFTKKWVSNLLFRLDGSHQ
ncbi:uncharacterized protein LOC116297554 [Actinia tenebrosa]|uniref:Uncharacterized protein LOC116297554 n=1 Tax=Actinia tenebrosa TaxID=6105 RepID=A0A6P8I2A3_ACTTE|nr:uncharacterized protein LOC116297554 [Actinia tenebrosa]